jgi:hypothetical protein
MLTDVFFEKTAKLDKITLVILFKLALASGRSVDERCRGMHPTRSVYVLIVGTMKDWEGEVD